MASTVCKSSTFSFIQHIQHIQHVDSTNITSSSTLHLFVTQVMADFLILDTPAKLGQPRREEWHRGLMKEVILQKAPCPMDCSLVIWLGKQKGKKWGIPRLSKGGNSAKGGWSKGRMTRSESWPDFSSRKCSLPWEGTWEEQARDSGHCYNQGNVGVTGALESSWGPIIWTGTQFVRLTRITRWSPPTVDLEWH